MIAENFLEDVRVGFIGITDLPCNQPFHLHNSMNRMPNPVDDHQPIITQSAKPTSFFSVLLSDPSPKKLQSEMVILIKLNRSIRLMSLQCLNNLSHIKLKITVKLLWWDRMKILNCPLRCSPLKLKKKFGIPGYGIAIYACL
jgi:hypothetical protein